MDTVTVVLCFFSLLSIAHCLTVSGVLISFFYNILPNKRNLLTYQDSLFVAAFANGSIAQVAVV